MCKDFENRSDKVLIYLIIHRIESLVKADQRIKIVYFHNFSCFDGILLINNIIRLNNYQIKPLMRDNVLYELALFNESFTKHLFTFRDSCRLLPASLN